MPPRREEDGAARLMLGPTLAALSIVAASPSAAVSVPVATIWVSPAKATSIGPPPAWSGLTITRRRALVGRIETQALLGDRIVVLRRAGAWTKVALPDQPSPKDPRGYPGWMRTGELRTAATTSAGVVVTARTATITSGRRHTIVSYGTRLDSRWTVAPSAVAAKPAPTAAAIVADARRFVGTRYLWGGTSAYGWDCSGLVHLVFRTHGVTIPRDADAQAAGGTPVARTALRAGDLVFYGRVHVHHVALYLGAGRMLEAPNSASRVRVVPVRDDDYAGARRYVP